MISKQQAHVEVTYSACIIPPLRHFFGRGWVEEKNEMETLVGWPVYPLPFFLLVQTSPNIPSPRHSSGQLFPYWPEMMSTCLPHLPACNTMPSEYISPAKKLRGLRRLMSFKLKNFNPPQNNRAANLSIKNMTFISIPAVKIALSIRKTWKKTFLLGQRHSLVARQYSAVYHQHPLSLTFIPTL